MSWIQSGAVFCLGAIPRKDLAFFGLPPLFGVVGSMVFNGKIKKAIQILAALVLVERPFLDYPSDVRATTTEQVTLVQ